MNTLYEQIFNQQNVQMDYLNKLKQQQIHDAQQHKEIAKAVKALHDYCDAARKIEPENRQMAIQQCIEALLIEMSKG